MCNRLRPHQISLACVAALGLILPTRGQGPAFVTKASQLHEISASDFLSGCAMRLEGTCTLVETNRNLAVIQDPTGAVAVYLGAQINEVGPGQHIRIESSNCSPYVAQFPNFPFSPSGQDVRPAFEAPTNWGDYHLQRLRGFLHPPASGDYTFWIASDNSSELWLSPNDSPAHIARIAFIEQGSWVNPRDWTRYRSQRSETVHLEAGHSYYIEAVQEQLLQDDNLAVAWQGPNLPRSVIDGVYLTPPSGGPAGILRESWTNYTAGTVEGVSGPRPFDSMITPQNPSITVLGPGEMPPPTPINLSQAMEPEEDFRWASVEGTLSFAGGSAAGGVLTLADVSGTVQVNVKDFNAAGLAELQSGRVRVTGVCEGARGQNGELRPSFVWTPSIANVSPAEIAVTNVEVVVAAPITNARPFGADVPMGGFYWTRGTITFNDRGLDANYLIVQEASAAVFVSPPQPRLTEGLRVGELVEIGGRFTPGKLGPELIPMVIHERGLVPMPATTDVSVKPGPRGRPEGLWTELEGIVQAVNPDGSLLLMARAGSFRTLVKNEDSKALANFVDAKVRVRGVLLGSLADGPLLLVPAPRFVELVDQPEPDPFSAPLRHVADLGADRTDPSFGHRVRLLASATYQAGPILFVQDNTGATRIRLASEVTAPLGAPMVVSGFPDITGLVPILTEAVIEPTHQVEIAQPVAIGPDQAMTLRQDAELVAMLGTLIDESRDTNGVNLNLQLGQHVFAARLAAGRGQLPQFAPGSVLKLTGVCNFTEADALALAVAPNVSAGAAFTLLLRSPGNVALVHGPPWWTWKRAAGLIVALVLVLCGAVLWIRLLRLRLHRQQAARLAFSRQILRSQETERGRIAANLHDGLGQNLLVIKNQVCLAMQPGGDESTLRKRLDEISGVTSQAIEDVRQITLGLRPYQLDRLGLTQAIKSAVNLVAEHSSILFATHVDNIDGMFDSESEIHVYRIVQETVNNIVKHSAATEAAVVVKFGGPSVALSIRDNGRGFVVGLNGAASGYGLTGITERARILGGTLAIDSHPGGGATLSIQIPVQVDLNAKRTQTAHRG